MDIILLITGLSVIKLNMEDILELDITSALKLRIKNILELGLGATKSNIEDILELDITGTS